MAQQTAMQIMYDELMAYEYTIPLSLIVKCKELIDVEKHHIMSAYDLGNQNQYNKICISNYVNIDEEQYYNQIYNKQNKNNEDY